MTNQLQILILSLPCSGLHGYTVNLTGQHVHFKISIMQSGWTSGEISTLTSVGHFQNCWAILYYYMLQL